MNKSPEQRMVESVRAVREREFTPDYVKAVGKTARPWKSRLSDAERFGDIVVATK